MCQRKNSFLIASFGLALTLASCKPTSEQGSETKTFPFTDSLWPVRDIPYCFEKGHDLDNDQLGGMGLVRNGQPFPRRNMVEEALTRGFSSSVLKFHLVGDAEGTCLDRGQKNDLVEKFLQRNIEPVRVALKSSDSVQVYQFGKYLAGYRGGVILNVPERVVTDKKFRCQMGTTPEEKTASYYRCFSLYVLHEFFHVAGYLHEQNKNNEDRNQASVTDQCRHYDQTKGAGDSRGDSSRDYDPESISNYCQNYSDLVAGTHASLSAKDLEGLSLDYGDKPQVIEWNPSPEELASYRDSLTRADEQDLTGIQEGTLFQGTGRGLSEPTQSFANTIQRTDDGSAKQCLVDLSFFLYGKHRSWTKALVEAQLKTSAEWSHACASSLQSKTLMESHIASLIRHLNHGD